MDAILNTENDFRSPTRVHHDASSLVWYSTMIRIATDGYIGTALVFSANTSYQRQ